MRARRSVFMTSSSNSRDLTNSFKRSAGDATIPIKRPRLVNSPRCSPGFVINRKWSLDLGGGLRRRNLSAEYKI